MTDIWREALSSSIDDLKTRYLTPREFNAIITDLLSRDNSPLSGLSYEVVDKEPFKTLNFGPSLAGKPYTHSNDLGDTGRRCLVHYHLKSPAHVKPPGLDDLLKQLFEDYWKPALRTPSAGMPDLKRSSNAEPLARQTVESCIQRRRCCSLMFCDLDGFKKLNDVHGQDVGDRVIKEFGALLEYSLNQSAILLHDGGDEFIALLPDANPAEAAMLAYSVARAVSAYDFKVGDLPVSISFGIASTNEPEAVPTYDWLYKRAMHALKKVAKVGEKAKARFYSGPEIPEGATSISRQILTSHCLVKSAAANEFPFRNVWLNCLSATIVGQLRTSSDIVTIAACVDKFLLWAKFQPPTTTKRLASSVSQEDDVDTTASILPIDVAFSVIHSLLRWSSVFGTNSLSQKSLQIQYDDDGKHAKVSCLDGTVVWSSDLSILMNNCFDVGSLWNRPVDSVCPQNLARAILVQIGHDQPRIPLGLFLERIIVDDRPTRGGGLPDFWEATLARLIEQTLRQPNVDAVYVLGDKSYAKQTIDNLRAINSWPEHDAQMAYKTGLSVRQIRSAALILKERVHFPQDENELLDHLSGILRDPFPFHKIPDDIDIRTVPFLRRELELDTLALSREDGCRVSTIAEAYPVVLEIARKTGANETITDQAGQVLRELIDFKVHLLTPSQNLIPSFYKSEETSFEEYYLSQFVSPTGLFGKVFNGTEQLEYVLTHLGNIMKNSSQQFSTRRAILVVPHEVGPDKELAPLGLISIRIIPRFVRSRPHLSFSYTWRTVEALKGFPYSLYGSVRFSQHLTQMLKERLPDEVARQVDFGTISYIAHSLHFFLDDYGQNIARRIVDEASY